jgi:hypothetical protein
MFQVGVIALSIAAISQQSTGLQDTWIDLSMNALTFWSTMQHSDSSFDEWYHRERSYAATAFSTYAATEALLLLDENGHTAFKGRDQIVESTDRAAAWLSKRRDLHVSNHSAGGIAALNNASILTGNSTFKAAAEDQLNALAQTQHPEGWLPEYRGMDPGYLTVAVGYLAAYVERGGHPLAQEIAKRAVDAATLGVNPDGSFGGSFGSRNTRFLLPHGLELLAEISPAARWILANTLGRGHQQLVSPVNSDDRYFLFFFLWSYLWAQRIRNLRVSTLKTPDLEAQGCAKAGIHRIRDHSWELITNSFKGAPFRLYRGSKLILVESGYAARTGDRSWATSQGYQPQDSTTMSLHPNKVLTVETCFHKARPENPLRRIAFLFALYQASFAHLGRLGGWVGDMIKRILIRKNMDFPMDLSREIRINQHCVEIVDIIRARQTISNVAIAALSDATTMHNPSSRFATNSDIGTASTQAHWEGSLRKDVVLRRNITIEQSGKLHDSGLYLD